MIAFAALSGGPSEAGAVSARVKMACAGDYFSFCSQHSPTSPAVRQCIRANGYKLSDGCVSALVAAGEVSKEDVSRRQAAR
jgi:hypothetical protein